MAFAGFDVPAGFAVTTAAWRPSRPRTGSRSALQRRGRSTPRTSRRSRPRRPGWRRRSRRRRCRRGRGRAEGGLRAAGGARGRPGTPVAVRSSGVAEDLGGASFAGQYETFLWVMGAEEVRRHVRRCWTGLFSAPVLTYRPERRRAAVEHRGMAVGVQRMVVPRAAGVMFTLDPLNGDRSKIVLEGAWGLGEAVVGGEVTPDRFRVDKVTLELLARELSAKEVECRFDPASRRRSMAPVPESAATVACLEDEDVLALTALGKRIERHRRAPVDIEWAVDDRGGCTCCRCGRRRSGAAGPSSRSPGRRHRRAAGAREVHGGGSGMKAGAVRLRAAGLGRRGAPGARRACGAARAARRRPEPRADAAHAADAGQRAGGHQPGRRARRHPRRGRHDGARPARPLRGDRALADRLGAAAAAAVLVRYVGDPQVRNRGTLGGSLAQADPTGEMPLACLALDATVVAASSRAGARSRSTTSSRARTRPRSSPRR